MNDILEEMIDEAIGDLLHEVGRSTRFTTFSVGDATYHLKRELVARLIRRTLSPADVREAIEQFKYKK